MARSRRHRNTPKGRAGNRATQRMASPRRIERHNPRTVRSTASMDHQGSQRQGTPGQTHVPGARRSSRPEGVAPRDGRRYVSTSVRELRRTDRGQRAKKAASRYLWRVALVVVVVGALAVGAVAVYNSPLFTIKNVNVNGVEHLTSSEMAQLVNVPEGSTLMQVDADTIINRLKASAWVDEVQIDRKFPDTLEVNVTERQVAAIVEIPTNTTKTIKNWAISEDHIWLMPIPDPNSEAAKTTSPKVYEDAESALRIKDIPFGTKAEIGQQCTDANVSNALEVVSGMTTGLADQVVEIRAPGIAETTLVLDNGVEVAFGEAEDIRSKERVIQQILEQNPDGVSYINVRMVETPTWRAV